MLSMTLGVFIAIMLLIMGLALLILGIFAAYFGSGKVRAFGLVLAVVGIIIGVITYLIKRDLGISNFASLIETGALYLISAIIGAVIALLIFLAALLKT